MNWKLLIDDICEQLRTRPFSTEIASGIVEATRPEERFERDFVEPIVLECAMKFPELETPVHPWGDKAKGKIWKAHKEWANTTGYGMQHTLDMAIRDPRTLTSIAIEIKFCRIRGGSMPNSQFQGMIGQALIGRRRHEAVIAVFGYSRSALLPSDPMMDEMLRGHGIWPVVRAIPGA